MIGRFSKDRSRGHGSNYNQRELERKMQEGKATGEDSQQTKSAAKSVAKLAVVDFDTVLSRWPGKKDEGKNEVSAKSSSVPPSDYFLGFTSHGTQIWGRLRQAGLETERIFDLDTRKVMIKLRCPADRLMDVAEVLRLKLKTTEGKSVHFEIMQIHKPSKCTNISRYWHYVGGFETFKESMVDIFEPTDAWEGSFCGGSSSGSSIFHSSIRQQIIDFIVNSQVRDSGAGLSFRYSLAQKGIMIRSPLHMHARLEALFHIWYHYTEDNSWRIIEKENGLDNIHDPSINGGGNDELPPRINRFIVGWFYQPLDSVEQYFGEKVAFYFAWTQHCAIKLIVPSILGVMVFLWQIYSQRWEDNEILPFFSVSQSLRLQRLQAYLSADITQSQ